MDILLNDGSILDWKYSQMGSDIYIIYRSYTPNKKDKRHKFFMIDYDINIIAAWCHENLGSPKKKIWGYSGSGTFYVYDDIDAMAFKLRWI